MKQIISKKGQAAMEFLMTYGWALLIVLIAVAALAYFGILNPSRFLPEQCDMPPGLTCQDFVIFDNGTVRIKLQNGMSETLSNFALNITEVTPSTASCVISANNSLTNGGYKTFTDGSTLTLILNCTQYEDPLVASDRFKGTIRINYTSESGFTKVKTGKIVGTVITS